MLLGRYDSICLLAISQNKNLNFQRHSKEKCYQQCRPRQRIKNRKRRRQKEWGMEGGREGGPSIGSTPSIQGSPMVAVSVRQSIDCTCPLKTGPHSSATESVWPLKGGVVRNVLPYWVNVSEWDSMTLVLPLFVSWPWMLHHAGGSICCTDSGSNWKP